MTRIGQQRQRVGCDPADHFGYENDERDSQRETQLSNVPAIGRVAERGVAVERAMASRAVMVAGMGMSH
jgi:hypothetical protein